MERMTLHPINATSAIISGPVMTSIISKLMSIFVPSFQSLEDCAYFIPTFVLIVSISVFITSISALKSLASVEPGGGSRNPSAINSA